MRKNDIIFGSIWLVLGIALAALGIAGTLDEFWSGMGSALLVIGAVRLLRSYRLNKSEAYREKMEISTTDERMRFLRTRAWSWAGYLFTLIAGVSVIVLHLLGNDPLSQAASLGVCLMIVLYWGSFLFLQKKY